MSFLLESEAVFQGLEFRQAPAPWVIWLLIAPGILLFTWFMYRLSRRDTPLGPRILLTALRVLALLLIVLLLMDPAWKTQVVETRKTLAVLMVDVSASMDHEDDYATNELLAERLRGAAGLPAGTPLDQVSRLELVQGVLDRPGDRHLEKLEEERDLRLYSFGETLSGFSDLRELRATDRFTALGRALEEVLEEPDVKSRPVGGIVLVTDGKNTTGPLPDAAAEIARRRKIPVHTVGVGDPMARKDVELVSAIAPAVVLAEDTMVVNLRVRQRGFENQRVRLRLLEDGLPLPIDDPREPVLLRPTESDQAFQLRYRPMREGQYRWIVEVEPVPGEYNTENNRIPIDVIVRRQKIRVLYVEGVPRWEYRRLKDFLVRGQQAFQTQCYLASAQKGFPQEHTPGLMPLDRFPETQAELGRYDVIIFGDVDPRELTEDPRISRQVMGLIREFVDNGGGFAMVAGDRFSPWAYRDTPIGDILPVTVDAATAPVTDTVRGFRPRVTELGRLDPIMQLVDEPRRNVRVWRGEDPELEITKVYWFARTKKAKPGARVLAIHETESGPHGPYPILVAGNYGDGPVVFVGLDGCWRWYKEQGPVIYYRFWGNIVRNLARTKLFRGDRRYRLTSNRSEYSQGDRITLTAYVKDKSFRPVKKPQQEIVLRPPEDSGRETERLLLPMVERGIFERTLIAQDDGEYQAWIPAEAGLSDEMLSPISFRVVISDVEREDPILDEETLRGLARKTDGRYVLLPGLRGLLDEVSAGTHEIPRKRQYVSLREGSQSWIWWLPVLFLALLTAEWLLRKRFRML